MAITILTTTIIMMAVAEGILASGIFWLRHSCPWLIVGRDAHPRLDPKGLASFIEHGWDPELGWIRKPNSLGTEKGKDNAEISYRIGPSGARFNPGFENQPAEILVYGDSYAFARQVNDDETWVNYLSHKLGINIGNYGVGNYGFDQALLRLEREFADHPASVVIMCVVPETMSRIHAYWKHYSEYGNTFAFKPRFVLAEGELHIKPNLINNVAEFNRLNIHLPKLSASDYFYDTKFKRDILSFPFCLSIFRNFKRTLPLMWAAFTDRIGRTRDAAFIKIMRRNIDMNCSLYHQPESKALFEALVQRFSTFCNERDAKPVLLMVPQHMDIEHIKNGDHYYSTFLQDVSEQVTVVDAASALLDTTEMNTMFINDKYGGHLSAAGNMLIARMMAPVCQGLIEETTAPKWGSNPKSGQHKKPLT